MTGEHGGGHGKEGLYHTLEEKFHYKKNSLYQKLNSAHSRAHKKAIKGLELEDTTGLAHEDILKHLAQYMMRYDRESGKAPIKLNDFQKKLYLGKAHELLESIAENEKIDMDTLMTRLYEEGVDSVFEKYRDTQRETDKMRMHRVHLREVTGSLDYEKRLGLAKEMQEKMPELQDLKAEEIVPGLDNLLLRHFGQYHERTVRKERKEKAKKGGHHRERAAAA